MEAAAGLFLAQGYQETSIKDITTHAGIARGLFHYYFKSKDEVLAAVVQALSARLVASINAEALFAGCRNAVEKINCMMRLIFGCEAKHAGLVKEFRAMRDTALRDGVAMGIIEAAVAIGIGLIQEGNAAGLFDCKHPREAAEIFSFGMALHLKRMFADGIQPPEASAEWFFNAHKGVYLDLAMRLLGMGAPHGLFEL